MKFFYTLKESALCIDEASGDLEPIGISSYYKQLMFLINKEIVLKTTEAVAKSTRRRKEKERKTPHAP